MCVTFLPAALQQMNKLSSWTLGNLSLKCFQRILAITLGQNVSWSSWVLVRHAQTDILFRDNQTKWKQNRMKGKGRERENADFKSSGLSLYSAVCNTAEEAHPHKNQCDTRGGSPALLGFLLLFVKLISVSRCASDLDLSLTYPTIQMKLHIKITSQHNTSRLYSLFYWGCGEIHFTVSEISIAFCNETSNWLFSRTFAHFSAQPGWPDFPHSILEEEQYNCPSWCKQSP